MVSSRGSDVGWFWPTVQPIGRRRCGGSLEPRQACRSARTRIGVLGDERNHPDGEIVDMNPDRWKRAPRVAHDYARDGDAFETPSDDVPFSKRYREHARRQIGRAARTK